MYNEEIWKEIVGLNGFYQVSSNGRIKSLISNKILKTFYDKDGYVCIKIQNKYIKKHFKIHRLVAQAFLEDYDNNLQINHKNGIKNDNRVENIEMCSASENINHSDYVLNHRIKKIYQYDLDNNFIREWKSSKDIEHIYGYNRTVIGRVCNGKRRKAYGYIWKYEKR